ACVRAVDGVVVHGVEECGHMRNGPGVAVSARIDLPRVADAKPEQKPVVVRIGEYARCIRGRDAVTAPAICDPRGDPDAVGRGEQDGASRERLACAEAFGIPDRVVPESLDLLCRRPGLGGRGHREAGDPDANLAQLDWRGTHPGTIVCAGPSVADAARIDSP